MRRIEIDSDETLGEDLEPAVRTIREGGLVAFPTETVYGLGARADEVEAVRRIFRAKERPPGHPLIVHVDSERRAIRLAADWPEEARRLAGRFWPGPLTLIVPKSSSVPDVVTGGLETVGLRFPSHPVARALIEGADVPLAAPSANPHTRLSPTRAEHVVEAMGSSVDVVVDAGPTDIGIESTVLTLAASPPTILRPGMVGREALEEVLGRVAIDEESADGDAPESPGRTRTHYAPDARLRVLEGETIADDLAEAPEQTGAVIIERYEGVPLNRSDRVVELPGTPGGFAQELYRALHRLDRLGCRDIWIEAPPPGEEWRAVRDRVRRASGS